MTVYHLYLSTTLLILTACVNGHIDFDGYEIYTRASTRSVINSFKLVNKTESWTVAMRRCAAEDAHLVVPDSKEELDVLGLMMKKVSSTSFHVGLTDQDTEGVWMSVLGKSVSPWGGPWALNVSESKVPNRAENCAVYRKGGPKFDDEDCDSFASHYVCEKEIVNENQKNQWNSV